MLKYVGLRNVRGQYVANVVFLVAFDCMHIQASAPRVRGAEADRSRKTEPACNLFGNLYSRCCSIWMRSPLSSHVAHGSSTPTALARVCVRYFDQRLGHSYLRTYMDNRSSMEIFEPTLGETLACMLPR